MKWISVLALVIFMASLASGYSSGCSSCRIRYSPYAFGYGSLGLVPECLRTSPYAFGNGYPSGLVPVTVRYSPYALTTRTTGLISDLGWACWDCWYWPQILGRPVCEDQHKTYQQGTQDMQIGKTQLPYALQGPVYAYPSPKKADQGHVDQARLIVEYLKQTLPDRFRISRIVSIDNQIVSFDILIEDKNLLIKYWNNQKIQDLRLKADFRLKAWKNYLVNWLAFKRDFEAGGGTIHHVACDDNYQLLSDLSRYIRG
ncbi:MAG: hypothetical protein QHH07_09115 [Sedimentisphaerales bacterium]|jgi:hypothetical protein|nr:hypothetical protein [Sedimentisphaerales bacterium]